MSSPMRQMHRRRLPPLPGLVKGRQDKASKITTPPLNPVMSGSNNMMVTGISVINQESRCDSSRPHSYTDKAYMSSEVITQYLNDNPDFLDNYVLNHVNVDRLQQWNLRKSHILQHLKNTDIITNGDLNRDKKSIWKSCVQSKKWGVLKDLTKDMNTHTNKTQILTELAKCAADAVGADGHNLYLSDDQNQLHLSNKNSKNQRPLTTIGQTDNRLTLPAYVALTKESIHTNSPQRDPRFPGGLGADGERASSAIVIPLLQGNCEIMGVVEIYRNYGSISFCSEDEEVAMMLLVWADICVEYVETTDNIAFWGCYAMTFIEMYNKMVKQRKLNDFLLAVTKSIFQDIVSMDTVIMKIMDYAKKLVNADRASLFLLDTQTKELYARIFDTGRVEEHAPQKEIRFPMDRGVAGHVASTGQILNIPDAYTDSRFNRDVDLQTGYRTKSILCMPIYIRGNIIGVVQMVNKFDGTFTTGDEESFETFAIYCGLALHHAKLYDKIYRSEQKYRVAVEVLSYHSQCHDEEVEQMRQQNIPDLIPSILDYEYSPWAIDGTSKPVYVLYMMRDIFKMHSQFDINDILRFTLTVRKNYRNVPYHNWAHAFSVGHAMFTVIKTAKHKFTPIECLALFVACLCHDLDHRGKTNAFMVKSASPLAAIYSTSTMEHHHFNHTVTILQNEGHNIFKYLSSTEYKQILGDIRHCILATDLALFFSNRSRLQDIADKGQFSWDNADHRMLLQAVTIMGCDLCANAKPWKIHVDIISHIFDEFYAEYLCCDFRRLIMANSMTACDLCSMYKPWDLQLQLVDVIMEEFWLQGDEEKKLGNMPNPMMDRENVDQLPITQGDEERSQGITPMPMMDREKKHELPHLEVGFLVGICLPCYQLMAQVLPETQPMVDGAVANLKKWRELAENQENFTLDPKPKEIQPAVRNNPKSSDEENPETSDKTLLEIKDKNPTETQKVDISQRNADRRLSDNQLRSSDRSDSGKDSSEPSENLTRTDVS